MLLDVRWRLAGPPGIDSYRQGHLPGAVFADLDRDLAAPPGPAGRHPLPDPAAFQAAMRAAGVSRDRPVVVYDDADAMSAARGWWTLRYFGHPDVRVLDGGYRAWAAAGLPVTTDEPAPAPGDFTAEPGQMPVLDAAGAQADGADRAAARRAGGRALPRRDRAGRPGRRAHPRRGERAHRGQREPGRHLQRTPPDSRPGSPGSVPSRGAPPVGALLRLRASPRPTRSSRSRWPASPPRSTSAPGPTGSPTPPGPWPPAPSQPDGPASQDPATGVATAADEIAGATHPQNSMIAKDLVRVGHVLK